jgi:amino acid adenylation domain-containing protein/non-ribosomal peptide synthase protein (TIGR01720 family)
MVTNNISELIAGLSPEKYALFAKRLMDQGSGLNSFPVSFAQERIWFIEQLDPDSSRYNAPFALRLKGPLDVRALEQALNEVTRRHEILRTIFPMINGEPMQVVLPPFAQVLPVTDLRALPESEREQGVLRITVEEGQKIFNLSEGPLVRTHLLRLKDDEHVVVRTEHHIISDASSQEIFMREVTALYTAYSNGKHSPLPELPLQYADFAVWQRKWLQGEKVEQQLDYWRRQLGGELPVLNLPADKSRPAVPSFRGAVEEDIFPARLATELEDLSRRSGVTLFITLLAAFQTLLHRYTAENDISVGTPILNRNRVELESVMGFFGNTLVMRSDLSGNPSFYDLLKRVREVALGAYAHQDVPFEQVARAAQPERSLSYASLVQVMFTLQNRVESTQNVAGLTWSSVNIDTGSARFDLMLSMRPMPAGMGVMLQYSTDLFNAGTSRRMLVHLRNLLEGIVRHPERRLSEFSLLSESERQQILVQWNDTARDYTLDKTLPALFEEQVSRTPEDRALSFVQQRLTYAELNARANQLARHLRHLGVKSESCVGIMMERSVEMVVSLWAVLKAGGVYVPLDPAYPRERLSFMLEDSAVPILLTQQHLQEQLPAHHATVLCVDSSWSEIARHGIENLESVTTSDNLAYVIYTSGSTGRPKGAMISHRGITNRLIWMQEAYRLTGSETVLQKTPFSFDVSVWEFFWPMLVGARLVLAIPGGHQDSAYLVRVIREEEVTTLHFVPSMLQVFLETHGVEQCSSLRRVICSGEALSTELRQRFFARMGAQLHNLYGPTEASVDVTFWECQPDEMRTSVPIGRPVANTQIYILDNHLQPVPAGVPGELYIGGVQLGRGYLRRPELTAEKFVPDPFSTQPGERLYRTGDQARHLHDGEIEFIGRLDHQVKLRGFRIELGEIEAALAQHPSVSEVAVVLREDVPGDKRLVAYLVIRQGEVAPNNSQLRDFLQDKLPEHMVPAGFMFIDALPLSPSGKLDRRALPALAGVRPELQSSFVAPRTHSEQVLAAIWSDVLRVERVGVHDDFFDLGGDSILSIQVVSRANQEGLRLRPRQIFQHHTVAQLAAVAATAPHVKAEQEIITGPVPLTPIQRWFFEQDFADPQHYNQAVMLKVEERLDASLLAEIVAALLEQHDALRLRFIWNGEEWRQIDEEVDTTADVFVRVDLRHLAAEEQRQAIEEKATEFQRSLDLTQGPLIKIALLELGDEKASRLLIVIHHLVVDGVSWRILLEDLEKAYRQRSSGERINLGPKTTSFKEWSQRLEQHQRSTAAEPEFDYWSADARRDIKPLPAEIVGGLNTVQHEQSVSSSLDVEETHALLHEVGAAYHTQINDVLLAALLRALSQWTGERRVLIDLEGHGREDIAEDVDISRTVGWFTTIFPVLLEQEGVWHPGETLKLVKEQLRAIPQNGIGYGLLRYLSGDESSKQQLRELPRSEVIFNYLGQLDGMLSATGGFSPAPESPGAMRSPRGKRTHLLDVSASIVGGRLQVAWSYSKEVFHQQTVERLAAGFNEALRGIMAHCLSTEPSWTPSDFPLAKLNDAQLQRVLHAEKDVEDLYTLSPMQEGMLFQSLFEAGTGVYLTQVTCELSGELDSSAFEQSWQQVVNRHASLRTSFQWDGLDAPVQIVNRHVEIEVEQLDWRGFELAEQQDRLEAFLKRARQRGFTLNEAPLMKLTLFRTGDKLYRFVWHCHHLLVDGWSVPIIIREVLAIYNALLRGEQPSLGESRAYRDFIEWLSRQDVSSAETYWLATLHGHKYPTAIQIGKTNNSETLSDDYGEQEILLTTEETTRLHAAARRLHLTLNTLVQGAWALLLSRYSSEEDVIFGVTSSGRPASLPGVEKIVGDFINTLPARVRVQSGALVGPWLQELQAQQAEQRQFEYSTLAQVHGWSDIPRNVRMFDSILIYENYPAYSFEHESGRQLEIRDIHAVGKTNYPLTVLAKGTSELLLKMWYASTRFDDGTISRMLGHFRHALQNLSTDPDQRLDDVTFMSEAEIEQFLIENPNGKVERQALSEFERAAKFIPPGTPTEDLLATIWANVLHLEQVGRHDDFFELGGHSLLANQVMSRVRETFEVEVPLSALFEYPTLEHFASQIEDAMRGSQGVMTAPVEPVSREQDLPLSFAQQRLWFLNELEPGSFFYNIPVVLRLKGQLNLAVLEQTLSEIIRRHEVLRTTFVPGVDGAPSQRIAAPAPFKLTINDISGLPRVEQEAEAIRLATAEAQGPFDLARGPLLRISLLRLAGEEHIALVTLHHIISDGWSTGVFIREVAALYEAYSAGKESPLAEMEVQYADYAVWQREWLSGAVLEEQLGYWREQLGGELAVLDLPTDRPRPPVQGYRGMHQTLALSSELSTNLKALCRREGVTLYMALLGAFQILLHRYTRQTDIVVGTPIAGRNRAEIEGLIGFFVNTLVMRTDLSGDPSFRDVLQRVRAVALGAYAHQDLPFEKLVEELQPERDLSRHPLFQVMFETQNEPDDLMRLPNLVMESVEVDDATAKFDLTMLVGDYEQGLSVRIEYSVDLFDAETIIRLGQHFEILLTGMVADPARAVADVPLLTGAEREQLKQWNDTTTQFPHELCFHQLFAAQVERTPDTVAAAFGDRRLSYIELDQRTNQLAHYLQAHGVRGESRVGVYMDRGLELLESIIAIFKAGGVYVPLDPGYPKDRLAFLLSDAQVSLLLTGDRFAGNLANHLPLIRVDADWETKIAAESDDALVNAVRPTNLAYVIYTSGSTGVPKGAMIEHRGMVNHLLAKIQDLQLSETDIVAQTASQTFDISIWQLLVPLLAGGRVEIFSDEIAHHPLRLFASATRNQVTILEIVPALLGGLLDEADAREVCPPETSRLRWLILTGDALPPQLCRQWMSLRPDVPLLNAYGPTECSDDVTHYAIYEALPPEVTLTPIGRAIANIRLYVADEKLRLLPVGMPGELYVGGVGVGRGYLNQPGLTAERFAPDPFASEPGARLYKTGDLARFAPDGNIEFLGRLDHQVKVRGFRIELGEIESALRHHEAVREAVVMVSGPQIGEAQLSAYVVPEFERLPAADELRNHLKKSLPEYMIPASFVMLEALPLTRNGKIDRRALAQLETPRTERVYVAPRTAVEEVVAGIWAEVLKLERVGVHDSFFDLGGHSLLSIQVLTRLHKTFHVDLPLRAIFEADTVAEISKRLVAMEAKPGQTEKIARIVQKIGSMSTEDKQRMLQQKRQQEVMYVES